MTHEEFISIVKQPQSVLATQVDDLKELVDRYPYFTAARLFYTKALQRSNSIHFTANISKTALYSSNRRKFYYFIYPEKKITTESAKFERQSKTSGNYFDMIDALESEGGDTKQSLRNLAEKLKEARAIVVKSSVQNKSEIQKNVSNKTSSEIKKNIQRMNSETISFEISEENAKKLIVERKYSEAIVILRALNLNNPKKSVYFADQIRFLEKVISNTKK